MPSDENYTLQFVRSDGRREPARQQHHTLDEAREAAEDIFDRAGGLYSEVEILRSGMLIETMKNPAMSSTGAR
jgi:hypothetical protein